MMKQGILPTMPGWRCWNDVAKGGSFFGVLEFLEFLEIWRFGDLEFWSFDNWSRRREEANRGNRESKRCRWIDEANDFCAFEVREKSLSSTSADLRIRLSFTVESPNLCNTRARAT